MPDLRYHLISLISVFLALAIGILLGVAMADRGVVSDRMEAEITSIQRQFARQQEEIGKQDEQIAE
jgi:ABC-type proline/glycine betaine transport system permease subunit